MKASLHVHTRLRGDKTVLGDTFFSAPFKLADISEPGTAHCRAMIMNASPGVLDGDVYDIRVQMEPGTRLQLETQAFQRVFTMKGAARQEMLVQLAAGASFTYIPHPSVPHSQAHFTSTTKVYMEKSCRLAWGEVLTPGRMLREENFGFRHYQTLTEIFMAGRLAVKDNLLLRPTLIDPLAMGQLEGYSHQATFLFVAEDGWQEGYSEAFREVLAGMHGVEWGISRLAIPGLVVRIVGTRAEPLYQCLRTMGQLASHPTGKMLNHVA